MSELVVAKAGYRTEVQAYEFVSNDEKLAISLVEIPPGDNFRMQTARERVLRQYFLERFEHIFFGASEAGNLCDIKNDTAMDFFYNEKTRVLEAYAGAPLLIENRFTGYRIVFVLENFTCFSLEGKIRFEYKGYAYFMEMIPQLEGNLWEWRKNRYQAYCGSMRHFLTALSQEDLEGAGYTISPGVFSPASNAIITTAASIDVREILRPIENRSRFLLKFPDFLRVDYRNGDCAKTAWLYLNKNYAIFDNAGRCIAPFNPVTVHGDWANQSFSFLFRPHYFFDLFCLTFHHP